MDEKLLNDRIDELEIEAAKLEVYIKCISADGHLDSMLVTELHTLNAYIALLNRRAIRGIYT